MRSKAQMKEWWESLAAAGLKRWHGLKKQSIIPKWKNLIHVHYFCIFLFPTCCFGDFFSCRQPDFWMIRCPFQKMVAFAFKPWPCPCISWKTHWWVPKVRFYEAAAGGPKMPLASVTGVANVPAMMGKNFVESSGYWGNVWTWLWQKMEVIPSTKDDVLDPA